MSILNQTRKDASKSQTERQDPEPAHFKTIEQTIRYPRASRPVVIQHNTPQTAERHRLAASHACTPVAATGITISPGPAQPSNRVRKLRLTESWTLVSGLALAFLTLGIPARLIPIHIGDRSQLSTPFCFCRDYLAVSTTKEKKKRGRGSMMCDYTQVEYACGHLRFTVRAWCEWSRCYIRIIEA